jgi:hypothetical protein
VSFVIETTKKTEPKRKPEEAAPFEQIRSGIVGRVPVKEPEGPWATKIVFLGNQNLEKLRGYKGYLDLWQDQVRLTITGLSLEGARNLYGSLEQMKDEEIHGK